MSIKFYCESYSDSSIIFTFAKVEIKRAKFGFCTLTTRGFKEILIMIEKK